ncbi:uncharacterized protein LOC124845529, partial [Vigna umbellata]|uniref:uncharacterized protein LOC124845529 n=1 Tax=Vigna umbellata TaxID=87088 RepID=UPI001F5F6489
PQSQSLTRLFCYPSHLSSIKIVAVLGSIVAVLGSIVAFGGDDDTIHLYDLSVASSLGSLHQHSTFVTALSFYAPPNLHFPRNLISSDDAGSFAFFDAYVFVHLTTLSVHCIAGINDLALHLSGELDR